MRQKAKLENHPNLFPNHVRCILCGPSNSGKTNVMINPLFDTNGLYFENVYVFLESLYHPKHTFLGNVVSAIDRIGYFQITENKDVVYPNGVKECCV